MDIAGCEKERIEEEFAERLHRSGVKERTTGGGVSGYDKLEDEVVRVVEVKTEW